MSLRIAFDLDGTLADLDSALDAVAADLFPPRERERDAEDAGEGEARAATDLATDAEVLSPEEEQLEPPEMRALTRRQQQQIWSTVRGTANFWETLGEAEPGIVARLAATAQERRWEVLFLTQRPACDGDTTQRQSQRWLARHGFELPCVYVLPAGASRGKVATALALDVVVDDRTENCLDVKVDSTARAFLVCRPSTTAMAANAGRLGIEVVGTVGECLDLLLSSAEGRGGFIGRLKKFIGA